MGEIVVKHGDHFEEEGFVPHAIFMDEKDYAKVLDNIVVTCVDICVVNRQDQILLGKRTWYPMRDWWIIGGRMRPGESFNEAAARHIKRELGLEVDPCRFERLWEYSMAWAKRAQPPEDNGCHMVSITMLLRLEPKEEAQIKHNEEYEAVQWVDLDTVAEDTSLHPALNTLAIKIT